MSTNLKTATEVPDNPGTAFVKLLKAGNEPLRGRERSTPSCGRPRAPLGNLQTQTVNLCIFLVSLEGGVESSGESLGVFVHD